MAMAKSGRDRCGAATRTWHESKSNKQQPTPVVVVVVVVVVVAALVALVAAVVTETANFITLTRKLGADFARSGVQCRPTSHAADRAGPDRTGSVMSIRPSVVERRFLQLECTGVNERLRCSFAESDDPSATSNPFVPSGH
ncbi:unnamed protein product [Soboliphyme baturini]|uniref:Nematode cuticle collagen N-terminal domain-containing protein n=1 Tax=Soboliphyme baturini TaxID=241478 RepID=A0A183IBS5_9BILA|nr:unnamed protein product [Soboliphyme baturini]